MDSDEKSTLLDIRVLIGSLSGKMEMVLSKMKELEQIVRENVSRLDKANGIFPAIKDGLKEMRTAFNTHVGHNTEAKIRWGDRIFKILLCAFNAIVIYLLIKLRGGTH